MAISNDFNNRLKNAIKESTGTPNQAGMVVLNPDGSNIGGGTSGIEYNATPPVIADGGTDAAQADVNGNTKIVEQYAPNYEDNTNGVAASILKPIASSIYVPSVYKDFGTVTKANIKALLGNVYSVFVTNTNAAARFFQLHNKATAPVATETAQVYWVIPAGSAASPGILRLDTSFFAPSEYFATGIGWAISTTATTFTDSATANEHAVHIRFA